MAKKYEITAHAYDKRGRLLAVGRNSYTKTHPLQASYARRVGKPDASYLHAEFAALLRARQPVYKLVVRRENKDGSTGNSKPCPICAAFIADQGVVVVEHT